MQEKFEKVLSGELKTEELTAEEAVEFHKFVSNASQEKLNEYKGLKEARQAEEKKLKDAQEEAERLEKEKAEKEKEKETTPEPREKEDEKKDERMDQFRDEQVQKAKDKLFSGIKLSDEDRKVVEEKFERLDSGKLDSDLIYKDLLSALAASKPDEYLNLLREKQESEDEAEEFNAGEAGGSPDANPSGGDKPKFSEEVMKLSKEAGITPEAAQRQINEGNKRVLD